MVSKFKNSFLVQKSIESAIQRLLNFFRLCSGFVIFLYSDRAQSWFLNSKILFVFGNRSRARSKDYYIFFRSNSGSEIDRERDPSTFIFFQIELWVDIHFFFKSTSELLSKFKNSIRLWKPIQSTV